MARSYGYNVLLQRSAQGPEAAGLPFISMLVYQ